MIDPFSQLIGQPTAVELLETAIATGRIAPAYLFVGAEGVGRALAARCFIQMLLIAGEEDYETARKKIEAGNHPDLLWVEPTYSHEGKLLGVREARARGFRGKMPPQIRIEQIREISQFLARPPLKSPRLLVAIDGAHAMAESAANALLKTLEEPGKGTIILIAPSSDALLPTLISRCQKIPFYRLSDRQMTLVLGRRDAEEILQYPELIQLAQGSPGQAIANWQKFKEIPSELISKLRQFPDNPIDALRSAKAITQEIELETQWWLIDYLQYLSWSQNRKKDVIELLEKARQALQSHVQPRLVWECLFLSIQGQFNRR